MANIGKCLLFYLKYAAEMERLYEPLLEGEEPNVEGLPDPDENLARIKLVGDKACREAVELLESCVPTIDQHFRAISSLRRKRGNLEANWVIKFWIASRNSAERRFEIGVSIDPYRQALIPWLWRPGGRRAEDDVLRILGSGTGSAELGWGSGSVALAKIKIPVPDQLDEAVACEPLLAQVQQAFGSFTAQDVEAIAAIASRGESEG